MRSTVHSTTDAEERTSGRGGNLFRRFLEGGVRQHASPRPSNVHEVDASLLELQLLFVVLPDGIDIWSEAEKGETFRRLVFNLLRADGNGADKRGSDQQNSGNKRGGELHGGGLGAGVQGTEDDWGSSGKGGGARSALYRVRGGVGNVGGFPEAGASQSVIWR